MDKISEIFMLEIKKNGHANEISIIINALDAIIERQNRIVEFITSGVLSKEAADKLIEEWRMIDALK